LIRNDKFREYGMGMVTVGALISDNDDPVCDNSSILKGYQATLIDRMLFPIGMFDTTIGAYVVPWVKLGHTLKKKCFSRDIYKI
jgi:hypothetical protein